MSMSRTSVGPKARHSSPSIKASRKFSLRARTKFSGCQCVGTIRRTEAAVGAESICLCHRRRARTESIVASPSVGPSGEVYVAWNDYVANAIVFNSSYDGGHSWGVPRTISSKTLPFDIGIPAESFRGALVYPSLDVDRSNGARRGRIYCSWMDLTSASVTDIFISYSDNNGLRWSTPTHVPDQLSYKVDRFNHWLSVAPT